ncbi:MAG TPA: SDR family NAD(P)-dependent oxidoreductase [Gemmatimonadales bacterium]|nr:SDR family NAD(P)-dependent oxidoreductase [Gemmatimonadales bacterium]
MPICLVTGATEGIGRATAFALGYGGWQVGVCARTRAKMDALVEELGAAGIRAAGHAGDVACEADAHAIVSTVTTALGCVDALINNAGVAIVKRFEELTLADWDATMATNLRGLYLMTREVLPGMRERRHGAIVNVASLAGRHGFVGGSAYAASKHGVLGFSRALMLEVRKENVRVIAVCPGSVDTAMIRGHPLLKSDPSRILQPEDVAATIAHALALPERALVSELDIRPTNP